MALDNDSGLSDYPSPTNPLAALGIDPDDARTNPDIMTALAHGQMPQDWEGSGNGSSAPLAASPKPTDTMAPLPRGADQSAESAGAVGGAGAAPAPDQAAPAPTPPAPVFSQATGGEMESAEDLEKLGLQQAQGTDPSVTAAQAARDKAAQAQTALQNSAGDKQYQPSLGRRIWRGVRGGLEGLVIGGIPGAIFGGLNPGKLPGGEDYSAPNQTYQRQEDSAERDVQSSQKALDEAAANFRTLQDARSAGAKTLTDAGTRFGSVVTGLTDKQKADTDALKASNDTPDAKAKTQALELQAKMGVWDQEAKRLGLRGEQATFYRANGRMFDPRQASAGEIARAQALAAWERDPKNQGKRPTLDDLTEINSAAAGREPKGSGEDQGRAGDIVADAINQKNAYQQQWQRNDDGTYTKVGSFGGDPKNTITGEEYNAKVDEFRTKANKQLDRIGFEWNNQGVLLPKNSKTTTAQGPPDSVVAGARDGQYLHGPNGELYQKKDGKAVPVKQ